MEKGFTMDQAMQEAARCLLCHDAPCACGCPAGTEPDRFIRKLRLRNLKGAARVIKENNVLGGVCAVVCPTCTLCAQGCTAAGLDRPIRIGEIQRFLVEWAWQTGFSPLRALPPDGRRIAIIGAGPAGLTCAAELARAGCKAVVFERQPEPGGMLRYGIPAHRMSVEFLGRELRDVTDLGVEIRCGTPMETSADIDRLLAEEKFDALFLATGAWGSLALDVPHRDSEDVYDALSFLMLAKTAPDGFAARVKGKVVAVIGGGDSAMDAAVAARRSGALDVYLLYRRSFSEMPGDPVEKQQAIAAGIHFVILSQPTDYVIENGRLAGIKLVRTRLDAPDASGRRRPVRMAGTEHELQADLAVEALGLQPPPAADAFGLPTDAQHRIVVRDAAGNTGRSMVLAGGDAVRGSSIVARAVHDGKMAARSILEELARRTGGTAPAVIDAPADRR